jgi:hypothetical protein
MRPGYHGWTKTAVKWPNRIQCTMDAYSPVGIALVLLIAFMVGTATRPHHGFSVDLPQSRYARPMPSAVREDAQIVSIARDGGIFYGNTRITADESLAVGFHLFIGSKWLDWGGGVLEFLCDEEARDIRAGAVLSDEVYLLQFSHRSRLHI